MKIGNASIELQSGDLFLNRYLPAISIDIHCTFLNSLRTPLVIIFTSSYLIYISIHNSFSMIFNIVLQRFLYSPYILALNI